MLNVAGFVFVLICHPGCLQTVCKKGLKTREIALKTGKLKIAS
jgi:hypothetical protein